MKKKQKRQAELLEKRIQEVEGGATPEGGEEEDDEETTTTETTEETTSSATLSMSATLQDISNHTITGEGMVTLCLWIRWKTAANLKKIKYIQFRVLKSINHLVFSDMLG